MFTVRVTPLVRGQNIEELTYYSKVEHPIGSLITIPFVNKLAPV
jgi:hypothetical protein